MKEYEVWDTMAFTCSINTLLGIKRSRYEDGTPVVYIFSSCEKAEKDVYPFLSKEKVNMCRENVEAFYRNPNIQASWHDFILHPVCLKVKKGTENFEPVSIESIGCGQGVLRPFRFRAFGSLAQKELIEEMFQKDMWFD